MSRFYGANVSYDFTFNPASQTISEAVSNSAYDYALPFGFVDDYVAARARRRAHEKFRPFSFV